MSPNWFFQVCGHNDKKLTSIIHLALVDIPLLLPSQVDWVPCSSTSLKIIMWWNNHDGSNFRGPWGIVSPGLCLGSGSSSKGLLIHVSWIIWLKKISKLKCQSQAVLFICNLRGNKSSLYAHFLQYTLDKSRQNIFFPPISPLLR